MEVRVTLHIFSRHQTPAGGLPPTLGKALHHSCGEIETRMKQHLPCPLRRHCVYPGRCCHSQRWKDFFSACHLRLQA